MFKAIVKTAIAATIALSSSVALAGERVSNTSYEPSDAGLKAAFTKSVRNDLTIKPHLNRYGYEYTTTGGVYDATVQIGIYGVIPANGYSTPFFRNILMATLGEIIVDGRSIPVHSKRSRDLVYTQKGTVDTLHPAIVNAVELGMVVASMGGECSPERPTIHKGDGIYKAKFNGVKFSMPIAKRTWTTQIRDRAKPVVKFLNAVIVETCREFRDELSTSDNQVVPENATFFTLNGNISTSSKWN